MDESSRITEQNETEKSAEHRTAAFESPDYIQRVEDEEQEKYLASWSREHDRKKQAGRGVFVQKNR